MFKCLCLDIGKFHADQAQQGAELAGFTYISSSQRSSWDVICDK